MQWLMSLVSLVSNGASSARACDPAQRPELGAQRRDEVGGVVWVVRCDQLIRVLDGVARRHCVCGERIELVHGMIRESEVDLRRDFTSTRCVQGSYEC